MKNPLLSFALPFCALLLGSAPNADATEPSLFHRTTAEEAMKKLVAKMPGE